MAFNLRIDMRDVEALARRIGVTEGAITRMLPGIINEAGSEMRRDIATQIADDWQIPEGNVAEALIENPSSGLELRYRLTGNSRHLDYVVWITAEDEKVCTICAPLHNQILDRDSATKMHPAHPNCRCDLRELPLGQSLVDVGTSILPAIETRIVAEVFESFHQVWR